MTFMGHRYTTYNITQSVRKKKTRRELSLKTCFTEQNFRSAHERNTCCEPISRDFPKRLFIQDHQWMQKYAYLVKLYFHFHIGLLILKYKPDNSLHFSFVACKCL